MYIQYDIKWRVKETNQPNLSRLLTVWLGLESTSPNLKDSKQKWLEIWHIQNLLLSLKGGSSRKNVFCESKFDLPIETNWVKEYCVNFTEFWNSDAKE